MITFTRNPHSIRVTMPEITFSDVLTLQPRLHDTLGLSWLDHVTHVTTYVPIRDTDGKVIGTVQTFDIGGNWERTGFTPVNS